MSTWKPMPTASYIYCMLANTVAMMFSMHWTNYSINRQRFSANNLYLSKFKYKEKTMFKWWMCIASRPQTTTISHWVLHIFIPLQWRHNERNGVSNHRRIDCLLNRLFRRRSKETSKLRVTGLCEGNSPVTAEIRAHRSSNAENVSTRWRNHAQTHIGDVDLQRRASLGIQPVNYVKAGLRNRGTHGSIPQDFIEYSALMIYMPYLPNYSCHVYIVCCNKKNG